LKGRRLELCGVTVTAASEDSGKPQHLLRDVSFALEPGEWVVVTGPNGSGKSTFIRLLAGHVPAMAAEGRVVRGFAGRAPVPYVTQHPDDSFVGSTPWEDVLAGLEQRGFEPEEAVRRAREALERTGLGGLMHVPLDALSGGQKQLAAAAACLAAAPELLILDEADAMLDSVSREAVYTAARGLWQQGAAVVWVTQRMEQLQPGDRVAAFLNGGLVYDGGAEGFFSETQGADGYLPSVCARLGYEPPYPAAVALELRRLGFGLSPLPLTPDTLAKAVSRHG